MRISDWSSDVCSSDLGSFGMGGQNSTGFTILSFGDAGLVERSGPSILDESCAAMQEGGSAARVTAVPGPAFTNERSEERRVGQEGGRTCRSRRSPYH